VNRLPRSATARSSVWFGSPRKGKLPPPHGAQKLRLIELLKSATDAKLVDALGAMRALSRIGHLNRAALRKVVRFGTRRNWTPQAILVDLCAQRSRCCHE
jgi:hypothetical protein